LTNSNIFLRALLNGGCLRIFAGVGPEYVRAGAMSTAATAVARRTMSYVHI